MNLEFCGFLRFRCFGEVGNWSGNQNVSVEEAPRNSRTRHVRTTQSLAACMNYEFLISSVESIPDLAALNFPIETENIV